MYRVHVKKAGISKVCLQLWAVCGGNVQIIYVEDYYLVPRLFGAMVDLLK